MPSLFKRRSKTYLSGTDPSSTASVGPSSGTSTPSNRSRTTSLLAGGGGRQPSLNGDAEANNGNTIKRRGTKLLKRLSIGGLGIHHHQSHGDLAPSSPTAAGGSRSTSLSGVGITRPPKSSSASFVTSSTLPSEVRLVESPTNHSIPLPEEGDLAASSTMKTAASSTRDLDALGAGAAAQTSTLPSNSAAATQTLSVLPASSSFEEVTRSDQQQIKQRSVSTPASIASSTLPRSGLSLWAFPSAASSESSLDSFATPSEGLSSIHEDEVEIDVTAAIPDVSAAPVIVNAPIPTSVPHGFDQAGVLQEDLARCHEVMNLFLNSHIAEAERIIKEGDPHRERLYYQAGDAILSTLKGMMTFEPADLQHALKVTRYCTELAGSLRRPSGGITGRLSGLVKGGGGGPHGHVAGMTPVERHAELVYAETLLMKAVLGIVSGGEWMALVKEALNMRTGDGIYRSLNAFLEHADKHHPAGRDPSIDADFRSGVELGTGLSALMLSLLPGKVVKLAEMFGYQGSREYALGCLAKSGGWESGLEQPNIGVAEEGVRRPVSDMVLMFWHLLVPSLVPVPNIDIPFAEKIMWWNLARYPNGVFTLFFQSRLHVLQCQPDKSNVVLEKAIRAQSDYLQLQLIARWDRGVNDLTLLEYEHAEMCFDQLHRGSNWSKATYLYSMAAVQAEQEGYDVEEVLKSMEEVPKGIRKVVGKTIPIEKFVSRKARKFAAQKRLLLPGMEIAYVYGALSHSPLHTLEAVTLPRIDQALAELTATSPDQYHSGGEREYWDDYALAHFLRGAALGLYALPSKISKRSEDDPPIRPEAERRARAEEALADLRAVLDHGHEIALEHWLIFYAHWEMGGIYERIGELEKAKTEYEIVLGGKPSELNPHHKLTGKYSLQNSLTLKCTTSLQSVKDQLRAKHAAGTGKQPIKR